LCRLGNFIGWLKFRAAGAANRQTIRTQVLVADFQRAEATATVARGGFVDSQAVGRSFMV
jgi:hypothetical protein